MPLGANLQLLSGATSDSEETAAARLRGTPAAGPGARAPPRRFDRLRDDHL